ncbi:MAG: sulfatase [Planctomycetota bacterium]
MRAVLRLCRPTLLGLAVLQFAPGCGEKPALEPILLAKDTGGAVRDESRRVVEFTSSGGRRFLRTEIDGRPWVETTLLPEDWRPGSSPDPDVTIWSAPVSIRGSGQPSAEEPGQRLTAAGREFAYSRELRSGTASALEPGSFLVTDSAVLLVLEKDGAPPGEARLQIHTERRGNVNGNFRVGGNRFSGDGFSLWPGEALVREVEIPGKCSLRFQTCSEPLLLRGCAPSDAVRFLVYADGKLLFEHEQVASGQTRSFGHVVGFEGQGRVELRFEVRGALAYSSFLAPIITPIVPGESSRRRTNETRPNIVVFLADTFRADNMEAYGGTPGLTPYLDQLARESLLFRRSWSVSTHTLPAHASLFTGMYPHQTGVHGKGWAMSEELHTVAELLSREGYRTGAITDSVMVSHRFGMDQGFEWFDEMDRDNQSPGFGTTLRRTRQFLEADDGRPIFLFVQTYRVHIPYVVSRETVESRGKELAIQGNFADLDRQMVGLLAGPQDQWDWPAVREVAGKLRGHYLGGVIDLDRAFREFHGELLARGVLAGGHLIFTSDHGEAFAEHDVILHTGTVWEELARIPLFISGADITAGVVEHSAGLVDLAPTVARLAGLAPDPGWPGQPLLSLENDRPAYVFQCRNLGKPTLALIQGSRKVIGYDNLDAVRKEELLYAFDLELDPLERENLLQDDAAWPRSLFHQFVPTLEVLLQPVVGTERAALDAEKLEQLREMGYLGD